MKLKDLDLKGILQGVINTVFVKDYIEEVSQERLAICMGCDKFSPNAVKAGTYTTKRKDIHCTDCGCNLTLKTRCLDCHCPLDPPKWERVLSEEEYKLLKEKLNGNTQSKDI